VTHTISLTDLQFHFPPILSTLILFTNLQPFSVITKTQMFKPERWRLTWTAESPNVSALISCDMSGSTGCSWEAWVDMWKLPGTYKTQNTYCSQSVNWEL